MLCAAYLATALASSVPLVTFDGAAGTTFTFIEMNDPVMGGLSYGNFTVEGGVGVFQGSVVDVPSLKAPGFLKAATGHGYLHSDKFNDASGATHLLLTVRSLVPYAGYKVSLGHNYFPIVRDYKADFNVTSEWSTVAVPFRAFSDKWSSYTGEAEKTCEQDASVCVTGETLKNIGQLAFWAEGVKGPVHLEIRSIAAGTVSDALIV